MIVLAAALAAVALVVPNPMDQVIAQNQQVREEAERQAERIDEIAKDLEGKGADANDPRTDLAEQLRERLAERLRDNPGDLDANLARLGSVEDEVRAQLDPPTSKRQPRSPRSPVRCRAPRRATRIRAAIPTRRRRTWASWATRSTT